MRTDGYKTEREGCDLDTLLEILFSYTTVQSIFRHVYSSICRGLLPALEGSLAFEIEVPSEVFGYLHEYNHDWVAHNTSNQSFDRPGHACRRK